MQHVFLLSSFLTSFAAHAQQIAQVAPTPDAGGAGVISVDEIVVTATRSPQPLYKIGSSVTVLTKDLIKTKQTVVVSDLITQTPGVGYSRNGGVGGVTSLRIRGAETDQTVVIIDGVKLNDPSSAGGGYNFANLLVGDTDRIEVLRGAQSTLWGSQAIGGVVNIITTTPAEPFEADGTVEGGSRDTAEVRVAAGGASEKLIWRMAGRHYRTDGISSFVNGAEKDGYRNTGFSGRLKYNFTDAVSFEARSIYSRGRNQFDGFPAPAFTFADTREYGFTKELIAYGGLNVDLMDGRFKNRIAYGYTDTDRDNLNPDQRITTVTFDATGENKRLEYQGSFAITDTWNSVFGAENEDSSLRTASPNEFTPNPLPLNSSVEITSVYAQLNGEVVKGLTVTGGVRHDDHDTFGNNTLGQAAVAWSFNDGNTVLRASYGEGFKAPTLFHLYSNFGNTALQPEDADTWDAGIEQRFADGSVVVSAIYFGRKTTNQIDFVSCTSPSPLCTPGKTGVYDNIAASQADGVELAASIDLNPLTLHANYTLTNTENTSPGNANRGRELPRRPKNAANFWADYQWAFGLSTGFGVRYVGQAFDNAANSFVLKDYILVEVRAAYPVNDNVEIYGRIENLFDETYATTRNYGTEGRGAFAGLRTTF